MGLFASFRKDPVDDIGAGIAALNAHVGSWQARSRSAQEKSKVQKTWLDLLKRAQQFYEQHHDREEDGLALLAELYRQGHNMDLPNCAQNAAQALQVGLAKYPDSDRLNRAAVAFFLSVPNGLAMAEASLRKLRARAGAGSDEFVERALVHLHLQSNQPQEALKQANAYIGRFGAASDVAAIKAGIESGTVQVIRTDA